MTQELNTENAKVISVATARSEKRSWTDCKVPSRPGRFALGPFVIDFQWHLGSPLFQWRGVDPLFLDQWACRMLLRYYEEELLDRSEVSWSSRAYGNLYLKIGPYRRTWSFVVKMGTGML